MLPAENLAMPPLLELRLHGHQDGKNDAGRRERRARGHEQHPWSLNKRDWRAEVSMEHGNFIVNRGQASAAEVQELIARMQKEAKATRGITLETEVQILGEDEVVF
jgi:hypothetical protein